MQLLQDAMKMVIVMAMGELVGQEVMIVADLPQKEEMKHVPLLKQQQEQKHHPPLSLPLRESSAPKKKKMKKKMSPLPIASRSQQTKEQPRKRTKPGARWVQTLWRICFAVDWRLLLIEMTIGARLTQHRRPMAMMQKVLRFLLA